MNLSQNEKNIDLELSRKYPESIRLSKLANAVNLSPEELKRFLKEKPSKYIMDIWSYKKRNYVLFNKSESLDFHFRKRTKEIFHMLNAIGVIELEKEDEIVDLIMKECFTSDILNGITNGNRTNAFIKFHINVEKFTKKLLTKNGKKFVKTHFLTR